MRFIKRKYVPATIVDFCNFGGSGWCTAGVGIGGDGGGTRWRRRRRRPRPKVPPPCSRGAARCGRRRVIGRGMTAVTAGNATLVTSCRLAPSDAPRTEFRRRRTHRMGRRRAGGRRLGGAGRLPLQLQGRQQEAALAAGGAAPPQARRGRGELQRGRAALAADARALRHVVRQALGGGEGGAGARGVPDLPADARGVERARPLRRVDHAADHRARHVQGGAAGGVAAAAVERAAAQGGDRPRALGGGRLGRGGVPRARRPRPRGLGHVRAQPAGPADAALQQIV